MKVKIDTFLGTVWVVFRDPKTGNYLVAKRGKESNNPNKWNFLGGKIDPKESIVEAAIRECNEECKVKISSKDLHLVAKSKSCFWFEVFKKIEPKKTKEASGFKWLKPKDLKSLDKHRSITNYFVALKKSVF